MGLTRPQPRQIRRSLLLLSTSGLLLTLSKCKNGRALSYLRNSHDDKSDFRLELRKRVYCLRGGDEFEDLLDARAVVNPYSSNPSSSNEDLQDLECYKPVNNVDITTIGMVKVPQLLSTSACSPDPQTTLKHIYRSFPVLETTTPSLQTSGSMVASASLTKNTSE
eukprot:1333481-Amorphochlora_amoeboformis.AAC.2